MGSPPTISVSLRSLNRAATVKLGYWSALGAFVTWFGMGVESVLRPFQDNRRETFWPLPFLLTITAFLCMHSVQRGCSRSERIGFAILVFASLLMLIGNIGLQLNLHSLERLGAPFGPVIWLVGLAAFGIGTLLAGVLPAYAGWAVILLEPASILFALALSPIAPLLPRGAYSGNMGKGLALGAVALAFHQIARTAKRDPSPS